MARKKLTEPKIQRGLSLSKSLYLRIAADADLHGTTWNEAAESILDRALPCVPNMQISVQNSRKLHEDTFIPEEAQ